MSSDLWRSAEASALDAQALAIAAALAELENVHAMLEHRDRRQLAGEVRSLTAALRAEASTIECQARELRIVRRALDDFGFPLAITVRATTRHPRAPGGAR